MNYTVGIDLGTHQTKVCIHRQDGNTKTFEFLSFEVGGQKKLLFPSIVSINLENNKVSYGAEGVSPACKNYRYFKQATFRNVGIEDYEKDNINVNTITTWYLTYVLFCIEEKIGIETSYNIQMGVPSGINREEFDRQEKLAYQLLISAFNIKDGFPSKQDFLNKSFLYLGEFDPNFKPLAPEEMANLPIDIISESYATLRTLALSERLLPGVHQIIDIGGGTTDTALFNYLKHGKKVRTCDLESFDKGLNYMFEQYQKENGSSIEDIQKLFDEDKDKFRNYLNKYRKDLSSSINDHWQRLAQQVRDVGFDPKTYEENVLSKNATYYCGGGSMYEELHLTDQRRFTQIEEVSLDLLDNIILVNEEKEEIKDIFPILSNVLGLSIPMLKKENDEIKYISIFDLFKHLRKKTRNQRINDRAWINPRIRRYTFWASDIVPVPEYQGDDIPKNPSLIKSPTPMPKTPSLRKGKGAIKSDQIIVSRDYFISANNNNQSLTHIGKLKKFPLQKVDLHLEMQIEKFCCYLCKNEGVYILKRCVEFLGNSKIPRPKYPPGIICIMPKAIDKYIYKRKKIFIISKCRFAPNF